MADDAPGHGGIAEALALLERAAYDLRQGWPEAALDAASRAVKVLRGVLNADDARLI